MVMVRVPRVITTATTTMEAGSDEDGRAMLITRDPQARLPLPLLARQRRPLLQPSTTLVITIMTGGTSAAAGSTMTIIICTTSAVAEEAAFFSG